MSKLLDRLQSIADARGILVEYCDLGPTRRGDYCYSLRRIRLNTRLVAEQLVDTFAHELGHDYWLDEVSTPSVERRATETGAHLAITEAEYRTVESEVGERSAAIAEEFGCTPRLISAWRRGYGKHSQMSVA